MNAALRVSLFGLLVLILPEPACFAGVRHFTFLYEAPTSAPGSFELENSLTWKRTTNPERADEIDFRHELEIGVTNKFQVSIYLADWFYQNDSAHSGFAYS